MKKVLDRVWRGWKRIARTIGRANTIVLLTLFYFLVIAPLGALMRLFGWDPLLSRSKARASATNWQPVEHGSPDIDSLRRQS